MNRDLVEQAAAAIALRPRLLPLSCPVQHYAWGGDQFIPSLIGVENRDLKACAELWIGAHPSAPSRVRVGDIDVPLDRLTARVPGLTLPYLLKILDVRAMLSIQAHPDRRQAEAGFHRENAAGIPLSAPHRLYKDAAHKPEACVALSDFWALYGFKTPETIGATLDAVPELGALAPEFDSKVAQAGADPAARRAVVRSLYENVMTCPQAEIDQVLAPLVDRLAASSAAREVPKEMPHFWAARALEQFPPAGGHVDRGLVSIYLLNLVRLRPGEGVYVPAGVLHAYLEGTAVEVMASSDNVVRGGLTPKHIDVAELLSILTFDIGAPELIDADADTPIERVYRTPAREFELSRLDLAAGATWRGTVHEGGDAFIVIDGEALAIEGGQTTTLPRGRVMLAPRGVSYALTARNTATVFRASVPSRH